MSFREKRQGEKCYRGETSLGRNGLIPSETPFQRAIELHMYQKRGQSNNF